MDLQIHVQCVYHYLCFKCTCTVHVTLYVLVHGVYTINHLKFGYTGLLVIYISIVHLLWTLHEASVCVYWLVSIAIRHFFYTKYIN